MVKFYLLAERQENAALLHQAESDNNRLNHKSHPLLYILHDLAALCSLMLDIRFLQFQFIIFERK